MGRVVNRGRIERLKRDTFSCPGRPSSESGIWVAKGTWLHEGRMFDEAVKFAVEENGRTVRVLADSWGR